jgi:hypothetical protein
MSSEQRQQTEVQKFPTFLPLPEACNFYWTILCSSVNAIGSAFLQDWPPEK